MPAPRVAMRRIRELLRLKLLCKLSHREIARALGVSIGAVSHYGQLAEQAGLAWPEVEADRRGAARGAADAAGGARRSACAAGLRPRPPGAQAQGRDAPATLDYDFATHMLILGLYSRGRSPTVAPDETGSHKAAGSYSARH
jgi:hypothetical protein